MDKSLQFDPKDYYEKDIKYRLEENATKYIDNLIKTSNVDVEANRLKNKEIEKAITIDKANEKVLNRYKIIKSICIVLACASIVGFVIGLFFLMTQDDFIGTNIHTAVVAGGWSLVVGSIVILIASLLSIFLKLNKIIKKLKAKDNENDETILKLQNEARAQVNKLVHSFDFYDFNNIVKETSDIFTLDDFLDYEKLNLLRVGYGLSSEPSKNESVLAVTSGHIKTNPFIRIKVLEKIDSTKTYTGTKVITWTERVSDGKGGTRTVSRSQTLTATVTKFYPYYANACYTIYANEAAPQLIFSRQPTGLGFNPSEKDIEKFVDKKEKKLDKMSTKSIKNGGNLTFMANTKFESLFGATNRNNETQYRLLFTPLAQQNMVEVITQNPYGDDFSFYKQNKINIVSSLHGRQIFEFNEDMFIGEYNVDLIKEKFIKIILSLYQSIYYELAPLLAIPLYQTTEGGKYDIKRELEQILSDFEAESFANSMNLDRFKHPMSATNQILKTKYLSTTNNMDSYEVHSASYKATRLVDYVSVLGGDGRVHSVAVPYIQYDPLEKVTQIKVGETKNAKEKDVTNVDSLTRHKCLFGFFND